jgi:cyanobactin maturation PatA/PatG family protease
LGYDFGSEARRDSLMQHMGDDDIGAYLDKNPSQAASVIWTLNLDATPIYAIQPQGAYASECYSQLIQFLREQIEEGVERVSIPGLIHGQARLMSGQNVPVIWPEQRCMYSWTTGALVEAVCGEPPDDDAETEDKASYAEKTEAVANFLNRVYDELRNLGVSSQDRAMNYAGANVANAANIFESALKKNLELYSIDAAPSPICRPGSDCWEVRLSFFDPENVLRAKRVYGFTADVSDVCPVMVGDIRAWSMP